MIPVLLIGASFTVGYSYLEISQLYRNLDAQLEMSAHQLETMVESGLVNKRVDVLNHQAQNYLNLRNTESIVIFSPTREVLVSKGPDLPENLNIIFSDHLELLTHGNLRYLSLPIHIRDMALYNADNSSLNQHMGWILVSMSNSAIKAAQYQILLFNVLIFTGIAALGYLLSGWISYHITAPVHQMINQLNQISIGNFETDLPDIDSIELAKLATGINQLSGMLREIDKDTQATIDQATLDLRENLETIEAQNISLEMAKREAIDASRIKSDFLANMSHEIRTPLNGILGFVRLLLNTPMDKEQSDYLQTIWSSSQSLMTIINDVLDFAKLEAGKMELDNMKFNLKKTVEDVLVMLAPTADSKPVDLVSLYYQDVPETTIGDQLRIKQIITNLVSNAIKFTERGEVVVRVSMENAYQQSARIKISVQDSGIGLSQLQQSDLFKAFQQADSSTARQYGGTGLGLIITKKIVEQMGGDIGLESEPGKGSTFWVSLKLDFITDTELEPISTQVAGKKALIYDTNSAMALSVHHRLANINMVAEICHSSELLIQKSSLDTDFIILGAHHPDDLPENVLIEFERHSGPLANTSVILITPVQYNLPARWKPLATSRVNRPFLTSSLMSAIGVLPAKNEHQPASRVNEGIRVLVVDDNPPNLKLALAILGQMGVDVSGAYSGKEALNLLKKTQFDLILMDVQMPEMDGLQTTQHIRSREKSTGTRIPIVALTAHALSSEKDHLLRNGMDDYLTKPADETMLAEILFKWTGQSMINSKAEPTFSNTSSVAVNRHPARTGTVINEVLDPVLAMERTNGHADLAVDMMQGLEEQLRIDIPKIEQAFAAGRSDDLLDLVHRIHGTAQYCGVPDLKKHAADLERDIKSDNKSTLLQSYEQFLTAHQRLNKELRDVDWKSQFWNLNTRS